MTLLNISLRQHSILNEVWKILCWRERLKGAYYLIFLSIFLKDLAISENLNELSIKVKTIFGLDKTIKEII